MAVFIIKSPKIDYGLFLRKMIHRSTSSGNSYSQHNLHCFPGLLLPQGKAANAVRPGAILPMAELTAERSISKIPGPDSRKRLLCEKALMI